MQSPDCYSARLQIGSSKVGHTASAAGHEPGSMIARVQLRWLGRFAGCRQLPRQRREAATRAAAIKGAVDIPTRSPFMLVQNVVQSKHFCVVTPSYSRSARSYARGARGCSISPATRPLPTATGSPTSSAPLIRSSGAATSRRASPRGAGRTLPLSAMSSRRSRRTAQARSGRRRSRWKQLTGSSRSAPTA